MTRVTPYFLVLARSQLKNGLLPLLEILVALQLDDNGHGDLGNVDIAVAVAIAVVQGEV